MRSWARRAAVLHRELGEVADLHGDPRWWLLAGGAALPWGRRAIYVVSDAEPASDTFIGVVAEAPADPVWDAIARAHAARSTLRDLDDALPDQPLAVTVRRTDLGAVAEPSSLDLAAFAIGDHCWCGALGGAFGDARDHELAIELAAAIAGRRPRTLDARGAASGATPFVTITIGDEPIETARHGHRRAWVGGVGPWLGLSRTTNGLAVVSTCHLIVDGFGHAWITSEIRTRTQSLMSGRRTTGVSGDVPVPAPVSGAMPLGIAWRELSGPVPGALALAYALGRVLHRAAGHPDARFSPTFQIPVAPGPPDPERRKRRVVPAIASVRFEHGVPEPFDIFAARTRALLRREAEGSGLSAQLLTAAQAAPAPLAWKRRAVGPARPRWLEAVAGLIGGRGCVSRIRIDVPGLVMPVACAVSSPGRLPTPSDPLGGCVVTVLDDAVRAAITVCGTGAIAGPDRAAALLDEVVAQIVHH